MDGLNLGCGQHFHPDWTNVDIVSTGEGVIAHDLRQGIPFPDASFDVVYHSHVLEHLPKAKATPFLQECFRVLRPSGVIRVVVPDLEQLARLYLTALEQASQGCEEWQANYDWILLEMYDQTVRGHSGGEMAAYLAQDPIPNETFVIQRLGREAKTLMHLLRQQPLQSPTQTLSDDDMRLKTLLGEAGYQALQIGRFRQSGEVHQWMYDRYSLKVLLENAGFHQVRVCSAYESRIPNYAMYGLDVEPDGQIRKPDSIFVEAIKPPDSESSLSIASPNSQSPQPNPKSPTAIDWQQRLQRLESKLRQSQSRLQETQQELERCRSTIAAMESSKFWKARSRWMQIKQWLRWIRQHDYDNEKP
jgi:predicted SAM-dependent methyltransferase